MQELKNIREFLAFFNFQFFGTALLASTVLAEANFQFRLVKFDTAKYRIEEIAQIRNEAP